MNEAAGPAVVIVQLSGADLTFAIDVTVETIDTGAGSGSATGNKYTVLSRKKLIYFRE